MTVHRCPDCRCKSDEIPQPSTSSVWAREAAKQAAAEAVKSGEREGPTMTTSLEIRERLDELDATALPELTAVVRKYRALREAVERLVTFYDRHEYSTLNVDDLRSALTAVDGGDGPASEANALCVAAMHKVLPQLTAAVRAMTNLADVLDELDDPSKVAARQIRRHLADALTAEEVAR